MMVLMIFSWFEYYFQVMTGDTVLSRCLKTTRSLEKSLIQIQNMVPVMLAVKVIQLIFSIQFPS